MDRAVFLDRDNTLIESNGGVVRHASHVRLKDDAADAVAAMRKLGYRIIVVTNQGGVAEGTINEQDVHAVHRRMAELLSTNNDAVIDRFYFCPYSPSGTVEPYNTDHEWRKPKPGMLKQAAEDLGIDLRKSWMVGDHMRDILAGNAAGTRTVLVNPGANGKKPNLGGVEPSCVARTLTEAADAIEKLNGYADARSIVEPDSLEATRDDAAPQRNHDTPSDDDPSPLFGAVDEEDDAELEAEFESATAVAIAEPDTEDEALDDAEPEPHRARIEATEADAKPPVPRPALASSSPASTTLPMDESMPPELLTVLRDVQSELKRRQAEYADFSWTKMSAWIVQMIAAFCALFAVLNLADLALFIPWIGGATFAQVLVTTLLQIHHQR